MQNFVILKKTHPLRHILKVCVTSEISYAKSVRMMCSLCQGKFEPRKESAIFALLGAFYVLQKQTSLA